MERRVGSSVANMRGRFEDARLRERVEERDLPAFV